MLWVDRFVLKSEAEFAISAEFERRREFRDCSPYLTHG